MRNIKEIVAENLTYLRKKNSLTQIELAKKINYSDKAVSRWENGEALPDVETLQRICDVYNLPINYLFEVHDKSDLTSEAKFKYQVKITIEIIVITTIWTIITILFLYAKAYLNIVFWQAFIWGIPITCFAVSSFNAFWNKKLLLSLISNSVLCWSFITSVYLQMIEKNLFLIFIIGVPIQVAIILFYLIRKHS